MQSLTLSEIRQVSGGKLPRDNSCSFNSDERNSSWGARFVDSWNKIADNAPDMHDRGVRAMTDIMCRITGKC